MAKPRKAAPEPTAPEPTAAGASSAGEAEAAATRPKPKPRQVWLLAVVSAMLVGWLAFLAAIYFLGL